MKFHIIGEELYYGKYRVGHVTYIDYRDNGRHGYSIGRVSNRDLLQKLVTELTAEVFVNLSQINWKTLANFHI